MNTRASVCAVATVLVLLIVGLAAPHASANCVGPKSISTYNAGTGVLTYWHSTLDETCCSTLLTKMWNGPSDYTGTCNFLSDETAVPGDIVLYGDFGDACLPGAACPSGSITVLAAVIKGAAVQFLTTETTETPSGPLAFDLSGNPASFFSMTGPGVTNVSHVGTNVVVDLSVDSVAAALQNGSASGITGYNILSKQRSSDPGRYPSSYDPVPNASVAAAGGTAGNASNVSLDCSGTGSSRWVAVQLVTTAGPSPFVGPATAITCGAACPDPGGEGYPGPAGCTELRGPIILQEAQSATIDTSSVPGITTLTSFGDLATNPAFDFPAGLELLATDVLHVYQLTRRGAVSRYSANGFSAPVSTIAPPTGQDWMDMATDPTTGLVYGVATHCSSTSTLHTRTSRRGPACSSGRSRARPA